MEQLAAEDAATSMRLMNGASAPHMKQADRAKEWSRLQEIVEGAKWLRETFASAKDQALAPWRRFRSWFQGMGFKRGVKFLGGGK